MVLGGGNVKKLKALPPLCRAGVNANAFRGGFRLWEATDNGKMSVKPSRLLSPERHLKLRQGVTNAARNDRTRPDGRQHGAAAARGRPPVRGLRHVAAKAVEELAKENADRGGLARGLREEARRSRGRSG